MHKESFPESSRAAGVFNPEAAQVQYSKFELHQAGATWMEQNGIGNIATVAVFGGPTPQCNGSLAMLFAMHKDMQHEVTEVIQEARETGIDPTMMVIGQFRMFTKKDENKKIICVDPNEIKKNWKQQFLTLPKIEM